MIFFYSMVRYILEYRMKSFYRGSELNSPFEINLDGKDFQEAALSALVMLSRVEFFSPSEMIYDARLTNLDGEEYGIFRRGFCQINSETGERLSGLEEKTKK